MRLKLLLLLLAFPLTTIVAAPIEQGHSIDQSEIAAKKNKKKTYTPLSNQPQAAPTQRPYTAPQPAQPRPQTLPTGPNIAPGPVQQPAPNFNQTIQPPSPAQPSPFLNLHQAQPQPQPFNPNQGFNNPQTQQVQINRGFDNPNQNYRNQRALQQQQQAQPQQVQSQSGFDNPNQNYRNQRALQQQQQAQPQQVQSQSGFDNPNQNYRNQRALQQQQQVQQQNPSRLRPRSYYRN